MPGPHIQGEGRRVRVCGHLPEITRTWPVRRSATGEKSLARIAGVNIPTNKRGLIALQYIHCIGQRNEPEILEKVKIPADRRVSQSSDQEVLQIRDVIHRDSM